MLASTYYYLSLSCLASNTTTNIFDYVWHLLAQANEPSRTHIMGNQVKFKSQWGSYKENQTAVLSPVGLTRGKPATISSSKEAYQPIYPENEAWTDRKGRMGQNLILYFIENRHKSSSFTLSELHLTHERFNNIPWSQSQSFSNFSK